MFGFSKRKAERTFTDFAVGFNLKNHPHLIPVGYSDDEVIFWDYEKLKNLFIIGGAGAGTSYMMRNIVDELTKYYHTNSVLYGIDITRVDLFEYRKLMRDTLFTRTEDQDEFFDDIEKMAQPKTSSLGDAYHFDIFVFVPDITCFWDDYPNHKLERRLFDLAQKYPNIHLIIECRGVSEQKYDYALPYVNESFPIILGTDHTNAKRLFFAESKSNPEIDPTHKGEGIVKSGNDAQKFQVFRNSEVFTNWINRK